MAFVLLLVSLLAASETWPSQAVRPEPAAPPALVPTAAYYLPRQIEKDDLQEWSIWLNLATPQVLILENAWEGYAREWETSLKNHRVELDRLARNLGALGMGEVGPDFVRAVGELRGSERSASLALVALDDRLFADLEAILAYVQKESMGKIRIARDRVVGLAQPFTIPAAPIDLHLLVAQLDLRDEIHAQLDGCFAEYDSKIAPELLRLREAQWRNAVPVDQLSAEMASASKAGDRSRQATLREQRCDLLKSAAQVERRIATINLEFCGRIQALLPMPFNDALQAAFDARAYPAHFPDVGDPSRLLLQMTTAATLDNSQIAATRSLFDTYRTRRDDLNRQLRSSQDAADDMFASTLTSAGRTQFAETMLDLHEKRREVHRTFLEQVVAIVPPEVQAKYSRELTYARAQVGD